MTFSAAATADSSSIQDMVGSDFLKVFTISMQNEFKTSKRVDQSRTCDYLSALLLRVSCESLVHKVPPSRKAQGLVYTIDTVLRTIANSTGLYALQNLF